MSSIFSDREKRNLYLTFVLKFTIKSSDFLENQSVKSREQVISVWNYPKESYIKRNREEETKPLGEYSFETSSPTFQSLRHLTVYMVCIKWIGKEVSDNADTFSKKQFARRSFISLTQTHRTAFQNAQTHIKHRKQAASCTGRYTKAVYALQKTATPPNSHVTLRHRTSKAVQSLERSLSCRQRDPLTP